MRHRKKVHKLGRPADQRNAILRSLATSLFTHDQITTTLHRAKALRPEAEKIIGLAKRGDVNAIRQVSRLIYNQKTGQTMAVKNQKDGSEREIPETVLRRIFREVGPRFTDRNGGYLRIIQAPPRRGDAAPMAVIELVD